ncbi:MAG: class I SAM-dependent methyltransferase [Myxococcales bacterium]|nr:class I SAM-dependent methyltransferase [Myxococcales bacterium]
MSEGAFGELARCPRCEGEVLPDPQGLRCVGCAMRFPQVGGIPLLLAEPHAMLADWRARAAEFRDHHAETGDLLLAALATEAKLPSTRLRLSTLRDRLAEHSERLLALLHEAGIEPAARIAEDGARVPGEASLTAYYHQIHRDWGWDHASDEVRDGLAEVEQVLGEPAALGKVLVLGAGACRLAYELHQRHDASLTVALDINPLPFLVARTLLHGGEIPLFELPIRPRASDAVCIERHLRAPTPARPGFAFLFADGLHPPFATASFDTVLTPWFIDQIPKDLADLVPEIHRLLRPGGQWLNTGPLVYHPGHTALAHRYCADEVLDLATAGGFAIAAQRRARLLYLQSPDGCQGRTEDVLTFRALRREAPEANAEPPWLAATDQPVPHLPGLDGYVAPHPFFAAVARLIDGQRSCRAIAACLVRDHGIPAAQAEAGVAACLREIHRSLQS